MVHAHVIRTVFEDKLPLSITIPKFKKKIVYSEIIDKLSDINIELEKIKEIREILQLIVENKDILSDLVVIKKEKSTEAISMYINWNGYIKIEIDEDIINTDPTISDVEEAIDKIEQLLKEEKRKILNFIKTLSERKLLVVKIIDKEEEDDC